MSAQPILWIVDDDGSVCDASSMLFASYGWLVRTYQTGEAFLEAINTKGSPDCVLLDLDLPGMSGLEVLQALAIGHPDTAVTVLTASQDASLPSLAANSQVRAILTKPIGTERLLRAVTI